VTLKGIEFDVEGGRDDMRSPFSTWILPETGLAMRAAGITAVSWELLTKVVASWWLVPFAMNTTQVVSWGPTLTKPVPVMVTVRSGLPAKALAGETELSVRAAVPVTTLKATLSDLANGAEATGSPVSTKMSAVRGFTIRLAGTTAVSWEKLMNVVDKAVSLPTMENTTMLLSWGWFENAEPVTVNVTSALPTTALVGEIEMFGLCGGGGEDEVIEADPQPPRPTNRIEHPTDRAIVLNITKFPFELPQNDCHRAIIAPGQERTAVVRSWPRREPGCW
jgi:hypothetical protein